MSKNMYLLISSFLSLIFFAIHNMKIILSIIVGINAEILKYIDKSLISINDNEIINREHLKKFTCSFFILSLWLIICHSSSSSYMATRIVIYCVKMITYIIHSTSIIEINIIIIFY